MNLKIESSFFPPGIADNSSLVIPFITTIDIKYTTIPTIISNKMRILENVPCNNNLFIKNSIAPITAELAIG